MMKFQCLIKLKPLFYTIMIGCCLTLVSSPLVVAMDAMILPKDVDGDGLDDLILVEPDGRGAVLIRSGDEYKQAATFVARSQLQSIEIADLSLDDRFDLLFLYPFESMLELILGARWQQDQALFTSAGGVEPHVMKAYPGKESIVVIGYKNESVIRFFGYQAGDQSLTLLHGMKTVAPVKDLLWADVNNDKLHDLILVLEGKGTSELEALINEGDIFTWGRRSLAEFQLMELEGIYFVHFNQDEQPDFLLWSKTGESIAVVSTRSGAYETIDVKTEPAEHMITGDFDGDGLTDILIGLTPKDGEHGIVQYKKVSGNDFESSGFHAIKGEILGLAAGHFSDNETMQIMVWKNAVNDGANTQSMRPLALAPQANTPQALPSLNLDLYQMMNNQIIQLDELLLPAILMDNAEFQNVVIYRSSDIANGIFYPYRSFFVEDWTTSASAIVAGEVTVEREIFEDGRLESAPDVVLSGLDFLPDPTQFEAHVNQFNAQESEFVFGSPILPRLVRMEAGPPAGLYKRPVVVEPSADAGATIRYRINNGSWQIYTPGTTEIIVVEDSTIGFYATLGGETSPIVELDYDLEIPPYLDSDSDDIPDLLERAFDLPIFSDSRDFDGDGVDDIDELVRQSNPKDAASMPANADGDAWSDYDEVIRQTDMNDASSSPVVSGLNVGEYTLVLLSNVKTTSDDETDMITPGSFMAAYDLSNQKIASISNLNTTHTLRLSGEYPHWLRMRDLNANTVTLSFYSPKYLPCVHPRLLYDGTQTASEWLDLVRQRMADEMYIMRHEQITMRSLGASQAMQVWMQQVSGATAPFSWGGSQTAIEPELLGDLQTVFDFDNVYHYFYEQLGEGTTWNGIIGVLVAWARNNPPAQDWDTSLQYLAMGEAVDPSLLPPTLTSEMVNEALADLSAVMAGVPTREIELTGVISSQNGQTYLTTADETEYHVDFGGMNIINGSEVSIVGKVERLCSNEDDVLVRVLETVAYQPMIAYNSIDTDNDGLPDQWEKFFFGTLAHGPNDNFDEDPATNIEELEGNTDPTDDSSIPTIPPTPTPTVEIPTPTPVVVEPTSTSTPTMTPTPELTPTPDIPMLPKPSSIAAYQFTEVSLPDAGLSEIPGGFSGTFPAGTSQLGAIPNDPGAGVNDGQGLVLTCEPGQVQMVITQPALVVGNYPALIRCKVQATSGEGQFALAAVDGSLDGSTISMIPSDTQHLTGQYRQVAMIYEPTSTDTVAVALQLFTPVTASGTVTVYIDDLEILPVEPGTVITQDDVRLAGFPFAGPIAPLPDPIPAYVDSFASGTLGDSGYAAVPGGFIDGSPGGTATVGSVPFGWTTPSGDDRGILFTCNPGETVLALVTPGRTVAANTPVLLRVYARSNSSEGEFAIAMLDGIMDGSISSLVPHGTAYMQSGFVRMSMVYEPTKTNQVAPLLQLNVPNSALAPVTVFIDSVEMIPFTNGTMTESAGIDMAN